MGNFVPPQLLSGNAVLPSGHCWLFERKYDGYRLQLSASQDGVKARTRTGVDWTARLRPWLLAISDMLPTDTVFDGELCVLHAGGRTSFSMLGEAIKQGQPLCYHAFDVLLHRGASTLDRTLADRKVLLSTTLAGVTSSYIQAVDFVLGNGQPLLEQMRLAGHEGIVAKRLDGPYRPGQRTPDWQKFKIQRTEDFIAVGYHSNEAQGLTSLILASQGGDSLQYRGRVGTGFTSDERRILLTRLSASPSVQIPAAMPSLPDARWLRHPMAVQVGFTHIAPSGCLLHPVFQGVREDIAVLTNDSGSPLIWPGRS
ncbi:ATP-dependent DNA ligase [Devosia sp.]|uniref:ATP-dependent DNA ligase n=1 Tax=Devosia sp. TaxID=1871048 RepID=UPI003F71BF73